jgi:hypothetical protein
VSKSAPEHTCDKWESIARPLADALVGTDLADIFVRAGDRVRAANHMRLALGSIGLAWNTALDADEAMKQTADAAIKACTLLETVVMSGFAALQRGQPLRVTGTRRRQSNQMALALVGAAESARAVMRMRGGKPDEIRDVATIYGELCAPIQEAS